MFGKTPKYKKVTMGVYPKVQEEGIVVHNVSKLLFYGMTSPQKLDKVGEYIDTRLAEDLARRRLGFVEVGTKAMNELMKACHKDLPLFAGAVLNIIRALVADESAAMNVLGADTFVRFAEFQDEVGRASEPMDSLLARFLAMAHTNAPAPRCAGLRALDAYATRVADVDAFVARYASPPDAPLLACLLAAMRSAPDPAAAAADAPPALAAQCLRDLAARTSHSSARGLVSGVLALLDRERLWGTAPGSEALRVACLALPPAHDPVAQACVLAALDSAPSPAARAQVLHALPAVTRAAGTASLLELLHTLGRVLARVPDTPDERTTHDAAVAAVAALATRVPDPAARLDALAHVLDRAVQQAPPSTSALMPLHRRTMMRAAAALADSVETAGAPAAFAPLPVATSLAALLQDRDTEVRLRAAELLYSLLSRVVFARQPAAAGGPPPGSVLSGEQLAAGPAGDALRSATYQALVGADNSPRFYEVIWRISALQQRELRERALVLAFPMFFHVQQRAVKRSSSIHAQTLVAAYLLNIAKHYDCAQLEEHARGVIKKRQAANQWSPALQLAADGSLQVREPPAADVPAPSSFVEFDRDVCVSALGPLPGITADVRAALASKFHGKKEGSKIGSDGASPGGSTTSVLTPQLSRRISMRASFTALPTTASTGASVVVSVASLRRSLQAEEDGMSSVRSSNAGKSSAVPAPATRLTFERAAQGAATSVSELDVLTRALQLDSVPEGHAQAPATMPLDPASFSPNSTIALTFLDHSPFS